MADAQVASEARGGQAKIPRRPLNLKRGVGGAGGIRCQMCPFGLKPEAGGVNCRGAFGLSRCRVGPNAEAFVGFEAKGRRGNSAQWSFRLMPRARRRQLPRRSLGLTPGASSVSFWGARVQVQEAAEMLNI